MHLLFVPSASVRKLARTFPKPEDGVHAYAREIAERNVLEGAGEIASVICTQQSQPESDALRNVDIK